MKKTDPATKKVKVALFLEPDVARALKVQAATTDSRGLSAYITRLLAIECGTSRKR